MSATIYSKQIKVPKNNFSKYIKVLLFNGDVKSFYYIDIRTHFEDGIVNNPTKFGICLTPSELKELLPFMVEKKNHLIDGTLRKITLQRNTKFPFIMDISLRKSCGKEYTITLSTNEIKTINVLMNEIETYLIND